MKKRVTTPKHEFPNGLQVIMAIGNGFAVNSPDGRNTRVVGGKLRIYNADKEQLAEFRNEMVVGTIKMFPQPPQV